MKLGFIGCGNMASAMIGGILKKQVFAKEDIIVSNLSQEGRKRSSQSLGVVAVSDNLEVVRKARIIILSVKPQYYEHVIQEIKGEITTEHVVITIAPGKSLEWLAQQFGREVKLVRTMPNTPALVGEGMSGVCPNSLVSQEDMDTVKKVFNSFGKMEIVSEPMLDVVVSVSGSSPAYVFMFIEAMADAAVADGMPRSQAYEFAAQAVLGSARMVLETGKHPGELKDMVCSPAGTTIEAVRVLEEKGLRSAVFEAMKACVRRIREM